MAEQSLEQLEQEFHQIVSGIHPADVVTKGNAQKKWNSIAKPLHSLGKLEDHIMQIAALTGDTDVNLNRKALIVMCADNGVVEEGVTQTGQEVTAIVAENFLTCNTSAAIMCKKAGVDIFPIDIGMEADTKVPRYKTANGTANMTKGPAMTRMQALQAILTGIHQVKEKKEAGYKIIATGEMGIGNTTTSSMLVAALTGRTAEEVTGRGAGLNDAGLLRKQQVIAQALEKYEKEIRSAHALSMLAAFGGLDIAGMAGVCIGGALYHVPVVLDGLISSVAALVAERIVPGVREFVLPSHLSKEPAAKWIAEELKLHPVIDAGLGLGEGTGAVMLFSLLDLALALYEDQTTFDTMEIAQYERYGETE